METGYWNYSDGIFTLTSPTYSQMIDDSDNHILDTIKHDYSCGSLGRRKDSKRKLSINQDKDISLLSMTPLENCYKKEDFNKMLTDWQEQFNTVELSDSEDIDLSYPFEAGFGLQFDSYFEDYGTQRDKDIKPSLNELIDYKFFSASLVNEKDNNQEVLSTSNLDCDTSVHILKKVSSSSDSTQTPLASISNKISSPDTSADITAAENSVLVGGKNNVADINVSHLACVENKQVAATKIKLEIQEQMATDVIKIKQEVQEETVTDGTSNTIQNVIIKMEPEDDYVDVDVETVSEKMPVLEAGDLTTLLEQFEASEAVNATTTVSNNNNQTALNDKNNSQFSLSCNKNNIQSTLSNGMVFVSSQPQKPQHHLVVNQTSSSQSLTHQNIKDSLPKEVIDRIKASGRKKVIPVIPAMPTKKPPKGSTRMQDAGATLIRNKLLKIVSSNTGGGESVQLDHNYCTVSDLNTNAPPALPHSANTPDHIKTDNKPPVQCTDSKADSYCSVNEDGTYSRLPEYFTAMSPKKEDCKQRLTNNYDCWEKNAKKDSGLESGEVSDASEETALSSSSSSSSESAITKPSIVPSSCVNNYKATSLANPCKRNLVSINGKTIDLGSVTPSNACYQVASSDNGQPRIRVKKEIQMISVLKSSQINNTPKTVTTPVTATVSVPEVKQELDVPKVKQEIDVPKVKQEIDNISIKTETQVPKKKKLNLEEYRSRIKERVKSCDTLKKNNCDSVSDLYYIRQFVSIGTNTASEHDEHMSNPESATTISGKCVDNKTGILQKVKVEHPTTCSVGVQTEVYKKQSKVTEDNMPTFKKLKREHGKENKQSFRARRDSSSSSAVSSDSCSRRNRRRLEVSNRRGRRKSRRRSSVRSSSCNSGRKFWSRSSSRSRSSSSSSSSSSSTSSSSSSSSSSSCSSCSRRSSSSRSRSRSSSRKYKSTKKHSNQRSYHYSDTYSNNRRSRSRSPVHSYYFNPAERQRQIEERRVVYVGRLEDNVTKSELRKRFEAYGDIIDISLHFREHCDNYGFVTYSKKSEAYEAIEKGNNDRSLPRYDICFGGRRSFCRQRYSDLDGAVTKDMHGGGYNKFSGRSSDSFDNLLREAQAKLRKRKV